DRAREIPCQRLTQPLAPEHSRSGRPLLIGVSLVQRVASVARAANHRLLIAILLAAFIIGLTMSAAIRRGMDHAVALGQCDPHAIAIALSDSVYHVRLGYVGLKQIFDTIQSYWNRGISPGD